MYLSLYVNVRQYMLYTVFSKDITSAKYLAEILENLHGKLQT